MATVTATAVAATITAAVTTTAVAAAKSTYRGASQEALLLFDLTLKSLNCF